MSDPTSDQEPPSKPLWFQTYQSLLSNREKRSRARRRKAKRLYKARMHLNRVLGMLESDSSVPELWRFSISWRTYLTSVLFWAQVVAAVLLVTASVFGDATIIGISSMWLLIVFAVAILCALTE